MLPISNKDARPLARVSNHTAGVADARAGPGRQNGQTGDMRAHRSPIDEYVAELAEHLHGPWLARRSIVRELRDGLADAVP